MRIINVVGARPNFMKIAPLMAEYQKHDKVGAMEFEIAVSIKGSYKSIDHRAKLFGRLIDEHEIISSG